MKNKKSKIGTLIGPNKTHILVAKTASKDIPGTNIKKGDTYVTAVKIKQ